MSDGPWGVDDSSEDTTLESFTISQNEEVYTGSGYRVERNIALKATTKSYVAAYRAFTPKFKAVDLSSFDALEFDASGTGDVEITIIKESIGSWENQFKTVVKLNEDENHFAIPLAHFNSKTNKKIDLSDAVSIVFTMSSNGVDVVQKEMNLKNINFSQRVLSTNEEVFKENETLLYPNPMQKSAELRFYSEVATTSTLEIYNFSGVLIRKIIVDLEQGNNSVTIYREGLKSGLYLMKLSNKFRNYKVQKVVIN
jgi:hypothetical protein